MNPPQTGLNPMPTQNMNHIIPQQIHPAHVNNIQFHQQIRHSPHQQQVQHHMNPMPMHHTAPHPHFIPPPNHLQYHQFNPPPPHIINGTMYPNPQPYHPPIALPPQQVQIQAPSTLHVHPQPLPQQQQPLPPRVPVNTIRRYQPPPPTRPAPLPPPLVLAAAAAANISANNNNAKPQANTPPSNPTGTTIKQTPEPSRYPQDPRRSPPENDLKSGMKRESTATDKTPPASGTSTPNTMFTKHWNTKNSAP
eukprot:494233_1